MPGPCGNWHSLRAKPVNSSHPKYPHPHRLFDEYANFQINECAVLFGARYGLSQSSELFILLAALLSAAVVLSILLIGLYFLRERQYKGSYVTREHSRTPLTMAHHISCSSSTSGASEPLTPPMPPPPPKATAAYFGI